MSDALASNVWWLWTAAVLLVIAGVAAEGYLAWMFIRDWREGRGEQRPQHARKESPRVAAAINDQSPRRHALFACAGLATVGLTAGAAVAQEPDAQRDNQSVTTSSTAPESPNTLAQAGSSAASSQPVTDAPEAPATDAPAADSAIGSSISVQLNLDFTNAYFYRGIRQQDKGLIVQPAARLAARLIDDDKLKLDGFVGTWNSFGPNAGANAGDLVEDWYESDLYAGVTLTRDKLSFTTSYTILTSPSDAFETVQELGFTLALDDSAWLKEWALKPYATLAIETGADASDGADSPTGVYLELGVAPGLSFEVAKTSVSLTFPASVGLSLSDYYQDADGDDETFGFAQVGAKASIPLGEPGRLGTWTLNAGVSVLFLGDNTQDFNRGDDTEVIGAVGVQWNF